MTAPLAIQGCPVRHARQDFTGCVLSQVTKEPVFPVNAMDTAVSVILRLQYARTVSIILLVISVSDVPLATMELSGDCQMTVNHVLAL